MTLWFAFNHTRIEAELSLLLPPGETPIEQLLVDQIRHGPTSRLLLLGIQGDSLEVLTQASRELAERMRTSQDYLQVNNGSQQWIPDQQSLFFRYRFLLSPSISPSSFTTSALRDELASRLNDLSSPIAAYVKKSIPRDPTGAFANLLTSWFQSRTPKTHQGVWISSDGRMALLAAQTKTPGLDLDAQEQIQRRLQDEFHQLIETNSKFHSLQLLKTGPAVFAVQARAKTKNEAQWLSIVAILSITLFIYFLYRSWKVLLLCLLPLLSGILAGVSSVTLFDGYIHGVTLAFGITLIGVAVDYPLHLFTHVTASHSVKTAAKDIWPIMRLGVITTGIGYSALFFSGFPGLTQLGVFAIVGLSTAALVTRWVLPEFLPSHYQANPTLDRLVPFILWLPKLKAVLPIAGLISLGLLIGSGLPLWEQDLANLSPLSQKTRDLDQTLRQDLGAPDVRDILIIEAETEERALRKSEELIPVLNRLIKERVLEGYDLAARYLSSKKTQLNRQTALPELPQLKTALNEAAASFPFKPNLFEPFIQDVETAKNLTPLDQSRLRETAIGIKIESLLFQREGIWMALVPLQHVMAREQLKEEVKNLKNKHFHYLDMKEESNRIVTSYQLEMVKLLALGGLLITLSLVIGLRSFQQCLRVIFPVIGSVLVVAALLHISGQRLSLFHLASFLLVIGIGLDYGLFFNRSHHSDDERNRTIQALFICCLTTFIAFGLLAFSQFPVLRAIGTTAAAGALLSLLFSATFVGKNGMKSSNLSDT